ncbi:hypothetical protein LTR53_015109 [Teratosphaeriaceae sp. CCFEE 6253]|nr:hypothetical protein LTR53_015109 [Teratosphaeriaceae sp. CCFEE 6253]
MASTSTLTYQDTLDSQYISASLSSLHRSRSTNSLIVRTYKEATQLYLTKRFKEALETLEPIISPPRQVTSPDGEQTNGDGDVGSGAAPVAQSSKGTRTKVWVFYLSLLHAIVDLGAEEGKLVFGSSRWKALAAKARDGTVWEEIVQAGYGGEEGAVDADVVVNLATLLHGHMTSQKLNQQRLESWLATSDAGGQHVSFGDGTMSPAPVGSMSPKALATRLKILGLYALHVLPANEEWEYARQFIELNESLDEERREAFMQALEELRGEKDGSAAKERELAERRDRETDEQRREEEARTAEQARLDDEKRKVEEKQNKAKASSIKTDGSVALSHQPASSSGKTPTPAHDPPKPSSITRSPSKAQKKPPAPAPPPANLYRRASSVLHNIQTMVLQTGRSMTGGAQAFRYLMFTLAFLAVMARRDVRMRVRRAMEEGWGKVKRTVGMGVKVGLGFALAAFGARNL